MSPWGWECRARLVKQVTAKPTQKRPTKWDDFIPPGPGRYKPPDILGGPGFSRIKRAPAYSFGIYLPVRYAKPAAKPNALLSDIRGMTRKGIEKVPHGVIAEKCGMPGDKTLVPGPGAHSLKNEAFLRRAPAYSMRIAAKPSYEAWDQWTPPSNTYYPPMMGKKQPAYSFGGQRIRSDDNGLPGPGEHNPKFYYMQKTDPAFSFGQRYRPFPRTQIPAPNAYCEKKLLYSKKSSPAPSFGIRHSKYLGKNHVYEMPSRLELLARDLP